MQKILEIVADSIIAKEGDENLINEEKISGKILNAIEILVLKQ